MRASCQDFRFAAIYQVPEAMIRDLARAREDFFHGLKPGRASGGIQLRECSNIFGVVRSYLMPKLLSLLQHVSMGAPRNRIRCSNLSSARAAGYIPNDGAIHFMYVAHVSVYLSTHIEEYK